MGPPLLLPLPPIVPPSGQVAPQPQDWPHVPCWVRCPSRVPALPAGSLVSVCGGRHTGRIPDGRTWGTWARARLDGGRVHPGRAEPCPCLAPAGCRPSQATPPPTWVAEQVQRKSCGSGQRQVALSRKAESHMQPLSGCDGEVGGARKLSGASCIRVWECPLARRLSRSPASPLWPGSRDWTPRQPPWASTPRLCRRHL